MKKLAVTVAAAIAGTTIFASAVSAEEIVVEKGDTLWDLARKHNTTVNKLMEFNDLTSTIIYPGQVLQTELLHTVVKGETLWSIARKYGVTVEELKERNNLTSDLILVGQVLTIPNTDENNVGSVNRNNSAAAVQTQPAQKQQPVQEQVKQNVQQPVKEQPESEPVQPAESAEKAEVRPKAEKPVEQTEVKEKPAQTVQETLPAQEQPAQKQQPVEKSEPVKEETAQTVEKQQPVAKQQAPVQKPKQNTQPAPQQNTAGQNAVAGKTITVTATAYTIESAGGSGVTATGINLKKNPGAKVIAVDPSVIPLGSKVYVPGYGYAIAGDTGGAIKGNKIDVYVPTNEQAKQWGVRTVNITIQK